jgi:hypothetical protein
MWCLRARQWVQLYTGAQINFWGLTSYLTYESDLLQSDLQHQGSRLKHRPSRGYITYTIQLLGELIPLSCSNIGYDQSGPVRAKGEGGGEFSTNQPPFLVWFFSNSATFRSVVSMMNYRLGRELLVSLICFKGVDCSFTLFFHLLLAHIWI